MEWSRGHFDPARFEQEAVNLALAKIRIQAEPGATSRF